MSKNKDNEVSLEEYFEGGIDYFIESEEENKDNRLKRLLNLKNAIILAITLIVVIFATGLVVTINYGYINGKYEYVTAQKMELIKFKKDADIILREMGKMENLIIEANELYFEENGGIVASTNVRNSTLANYETLIKEYNDFLNGATGKFGGEADQFIDGTKTLLAEIGYVISYEKGFANREENEGTRKNYLSKDSDILYYEKNFSEEAFVESESVIGIEELILYLKSIKNEL